METVTNRLFLEQLVAGACRVDLNPEEFHSHPEFQEEYRKLHSELLAGLYNKWMQESPEKLTKAFGALSPPVLASFFNPNSDRY